MESIAVSEDVFVMQDLLEPIRKYDSEEPILQLFL